MKGIIAMNRFIRCFNMEIEYLKRTRFFLSLGILLLIIMVALSFIQYSYVLEVYSDYTNTVKYYNENDLDIEEDLNSGEYHLQKNENGTTTVENPILYFNDQVCKAIYSISSSYAVTQIFEISIVFLPLLFFIIASLIIVKDHKFGTIRHKVLRFGRVNYITSKIMVIVFVVILSIFALAALSNISSVLITNMLSKKIPFEEFNVGDFEQSANLITRILLMLFFSLFYSFLGALSGLIFKNNVPGIIVAVIYLYILPIKMKYEPKNMVYAIMKKYFDFLGLADISSTVENSILLSFLVLGVIIALSVVAMIIITRKRSAYN